MALTTTLRTQHQELLVLAEQLSEQLHAAALAGNAAPARKLVSALAAKLKIHLAIEGRMLYPSLARSAAAGAREMAELFTKELGGLRATLGAYLARWPHAHAIQRDARAFVEETSCFIVTMRARIEREEREVYGLLERPTIVPAAMSEGG
jgi:hypothetical protein